MGFTCKIFGHKWNGCKCIKCGVRRDEGHNYLIAEGKCVEKCSICGKERTIEHEWNGGKCKRCGVNEQIEALLNECVDELVQMYIWAPRGFPMVRDETMSVRIVGKKLADAGGFKLMLEAHKRFILKNPYMGRNLEMCWDGIGGWAG